MCLKNPPFIGNCDRSEPSFLEQFVVPLNAPLIAQVFHNFKTDQPIKTFVNTLSLDIEPEEAAVLNRQPSAPFFEGLLVLNTHIDADTLFHPVCQQERRRTIAAACVKQRVLFANESGESTQDPDASPDNSVGEVCRFTKTGYVHGGHLNA